ILLGCGFSGSIPNSMGSLKKLVYLSLNLKPIHWRSASFYW
ncbi:hypothetical protein SOVF_138440, partial [Spinacia oleracea]